MSCPVCGYGACNCASFSAEECLSQGQNLQGYTTFCVGDSSYSWFCNGGSCNDLVGITCPLGYSLTGQCYDSNSNFVPYYSCSSCVEAGPLTTSAYNFYSWTAFCCSECPSGQYPSSYCEGDSSINNCHDCTASGYSWTLSCQPIPDGDYNLCTCSEGTCSSILNTQCPYPQQFLPVGTPCATCSAGSVPSTYCTNNAYTDANSCIQAGYSWKYLGCITNSCSSGSTPYCNCLESPSLSYQACLDQGYTWSEQCSPSSTGTSNCAPELICPTDYILQSYCSNSAYTTSDSCIEAGEAWQSHCVWSLCPTNYVQQCTCNGASCQMSCVEGTTASGTTCTCDNTCPADYPISDFSCSNSTYATCATCIQNGYTWSANCLANPCPSGSAPACSCTGSSSLTCSDCINHGFSWVEMCTIGADATTCNCEEALMYCSIGQLQSGCSNPSYTDSYSCVGAGETWSTECVSTSTTCTLGYVPQCQMICEPINGGA